MFKEIIFLMPLILVPDDGTIKKCRNMWNVLDVKRYCLEIFVIGGLLFAPLHICLSNLPNRFPNARILDRSASSGFKCVN